MRVLLDTERLNQMSGIRGIGVYASLLKEHLQDVTGLEVAEQSGDGIDLVHYPYFDFFFHTLPYFRKTKTVVTVHDAIPLVFPKQYPAGIKGSIRLLQQQLSLSTVNAVIVDSQASKRDVVKYLGVPEENVHVIYLAGSPLIEKQGNNMRVQVKAKYDLPSKFALYVGDINYNKNLPRLIEAVSMLPADCHLVMVGKALENIEIPEGKALHDAIDGFHVRDRVRMLTQIGKEKTQELAAIFSCASVYVQPSLYEGFGLSVLDAMQCETVVACSDRSSLPEVAGDAALYFDPESPKQMAQTIKQAFQLHGEEKNALLRKMRANVQRFSWEKTAEETVKVYKKVLEP